jgi:hypothetical protein
MNVKVCCLQVFGRQKFWRKKIVKINNNIHLAFLRKIPVFSKRLYDVIKNIIMLSIVMFSVRLLFINLS